MKRDDCSCCKKNAVLYVGLFGAKFDEDVLCSAAYFAGYEKAFYVRDAKEAQSFLENRDEAKNILHCIVGLCTFLDRVEPLYFVANYKEECKDINFAFYGWNPAKDCVFDIFIGVDHIPSTKSSSAVPYSIFDYLQKNNR